MANGAISSAAGSADAAGPILFFDGVCNLCDGLVRFVLRHDRHGRLRFAPLQSPFAVEFLAASGASSAPMGDPDSVLYWDGARFWDRSEAALRVCRELAPPWSWLAALAVIPRPLRDALYGRVAARRYHWFGRRQACRLPTAAERERFLG